MQVARLLERGLRQSGAVDQEALCVVAGRKVGRGVGARVLAGINKGGVGAETEAFRTWQGDGGAEEDCWISMARCRCVCVPEGHEAGCKVLLLQA